MNINKSLKNNINLRFFRIKKSHNQLPKPYFKDSSKVLELFIGLSKILRNLYLMNYSIDWKKDL
jgi:HKD family nuclease